MVEDCVREYQELEIESSEYISIKKEKPVKTYTGVKWKSKGPNKKQLSIDFSHRCCYCDDLDQYHGGYRNFHIEHFAPKSIFPQLMWNYDNLLYCCPICNEAKSNKWVGRTSTENVIGEQGFLNPCDDEYYNHLARRKNGKIIYLSNLGKYIYDEIGLYLPCHEKNYKLERLYEIRKKIEFKLSEEDITLEQRQILNQLLSTVSIDFMSYYMKNDFA